MNTVIKCPVCDEKLTIEEKKLVCEHNHSFDKAKQGYYNLLLNSKSNKVQGDSKEMLKARQLVFSGGYYEKVSNALNDVVSNYVRKGSTILDIGSGVGYYLDRLEKNEPSTHYFYGIDISKEGIKESSKHNKAIQYIVGTNNKLPFLNTSIDIITSVFSPIYLDECTRVLKDNGILVVIHPNQDHLIEMKRVIYDDIILKEEDRNELESLFYEKKDSINVSYRIDLKSDDLKNLLMMTPHYWTSTMDGKTRLSNVPELRVTIDVKIDVYQKK